MRAFGAARAAQLRVADRNEKRDGAPHLNVGIALHFGNAAYGNVGSGERLDYTVIGRDVNLASRIADLCGKLGECLLLSEPFQSRFSEHELRSLRTFPLRGVDQPQAIFAPEDLSLPPFGGGTSPFACEFYSSIKRRSLRAARLS
jgi:adenylate cyclase